MKNENAARIDHPALILHDNTFSIDFPECFPAEVKDHLR